MLAKNVKEVSVIYEKYIVLTDKLKDHYKNLEAKLKVRPNPFNEEKHPASFEEYDKLRKESLKSLSSINETLSFLFPNEGK